MIISLDLLKNKTMDYGINIFYKKLPSGLLGVADAEAMSIELDHSLLKNTRQHKCVLAEEIGHILHPPRPGHVRYHSMGFWQTEGTSCIKAIVAQDERKALDWATGVLLPDVEFNRIMENGGYSLNEIAEMFEVERWMVDHKIGYYRRKERDRGRRVRWRELIRRV